MPCYHPLQAWRSITGSNQVVFKIEKGLPGTELELPCGKCIGCRLDKAKDWAVRCMHEASLHKQNCFITLTYDDFHLPEGGTLVKKHLQNFFKRFRDLLFRVNDKDKSKTPTIRYYAVGEYGSQLDRPHYHVLLFGFAFPDCVLFRQKGKSRLYVSGVLQALWPHGFCSIGELNFDTACYCARYVQKKYIGDNPDDHYQGRIPEFALMSRKPGIGFGWFELYHDDIYNADRCVLSNGLITRPPKAYDKKLKDIDPERMHRLQEERHERAVNCPDNSPERLAVRKEIQQLKQKELQRELEQADKIRVSLLEAAGRQKGPRYFEQEKVFRSSLPTLPDPDREREQRDRRKREPPLAPVGPS